MSTSFSVNDSPVVVGNDKKLIRYLRDDLRLTSVKDGCSEGACGTCTILVDGKAVKACTLMVSDMEGKSVRTVEGLSQRQKDIFTTAFGEAGAVQCGFCIPGMVICSKALLDENPSPTEKDIRHALRNNICRCTGYAKIVKAVELAARMFREDAAKEECKDIGLKNDECKALGVEGIDKDRNWRIGQRIPRVDVMDKVTGRGVYPDDIYADGMLHVVAVRSKYPRARVLSIDTSLALDANGVFGIFTAQDIPGDIKVGHILRDWDAMIPVGGITRYLGDAICIVAGETYADARKAADLVKVQYEVLPFVSSPYEAMKEDAPKVHEEREGGNLLGHTHVDRGDVEAALAKSKYVLHEKYSTPWTEHAFLEPEAAVAFPIVDGSENGDSKVTGNVTGVKIYSTDQSVYDTRRETAPMLGLPPEKVVVENCYVGGGFGGKEDVTVQHLSALAALLTKRPCKMKLTRQESILVHPKRHPMDMDFTLGCDENGIIQGLKATVIADTGAYASLGLPVLQRACTHASGPYNYENFQIDGYAYYTNNPPAGAFRGFGVTQTCFAIESMLNHIADEIGISHWEIRYRNAIRPGQALPNGQIVDNATGLVETLEAVKDEYESNRYAGIACAMKNAGVGVGLLDFGRVDLEVRDGHVVIHCGGSCIGQGLCTILKQIVCDITGLPGELVVEEKANTLKAPDSGTTSGSRHTTVTGEAARRAALQLKAALDKVSGEGAAKADCIAKADVLKQLEGREFYAEYLAETDPFGSDKPHPKSHVAYGYATQVAVLDEKTHKIDRIIAAHDVGRAINPTNVEGQIEGGVIMGTGYALRENYPLKDCKPLAKYGSLGLFRADEVPDLVPVIIEKPGLDIANGGKGLGEITSIPTAPCIADAYYRLDGIKRFSLPIENTPYSLDEGSAVKRKVKSLAVNKNARCIGCLECVRTCSKIFFKQEKASLAFLQVREKKGVGNQSGIQGLITRPVTCIQCGRCADACPQKAISRNQFGVCVVDLKMCNNCGKCREACPFGLMVEDPVMHVSKKCIACGQCAKACPMGVLEIATPES